MTQASEGGGDVTRTDITGEDVDELVERVRGATRALIQGDVRGYFALVDEASDYTLMPPTGVRRGTGPTWADDGHAVAASSASPSRT
jgi:hypothetical protein